MRENNERLHFCLGEEPAGFTSSIQFYIILYPHQNFVKPTSMFSAMHHLFFSNFFVNILRFYFYSERMIKKSLFRYELLNETAKSI